MTLRPLVCKADGTEAHSRFNKHQHACLKGTCRGPCRKEKIRGRQQTNGTRRFLPRPPPPLPDTAPRPALPLPLKTSPGCTGGGLPASHPGHGPPSERPGDSGGWGGAGHGCPGPGPAPGRPPPPPPPRRDSAPRHPRRARRPADLLSLFLSLARPGARAAACRWPGPRPSLTTARAPRSAAGPSRGTAALHPHCRRPPREGSDRQPESGGRARLLPRQSDGDRRRRRHLSLADRPPSPAAAPASSSRPPRRRAQGTVGTAPPPAGGGWRGERRAAKYNSRRALRRPPTGVEGGMPPRPSARARARAAGRRSGGKRGARGGPAVRGVPTDAPAAMHRYGEGAGDSAGRLKRRPRVGGVGWERARLVPGLCVSPRAGGRPRGSRVSSPPRPGSEG